MRSNEEFEIGGSGIDTQYERDYINYRPKITHTKPMIDSIYGLSADAAGQNPLLEQIGESSIISVWEDVVGVIKRIDEVEKTLSNKLKDVTAPIHPTMTEEVQKAAERLGYSGVTNSIPFDLYKKSFESPNPADAAIIQDAFEDYMSDVDGNLNGELYTDVIELKYDWVDMLDFIKRGLFAQIVSSDKIPAEISTDDTKLEDVNNQEKAMLGTYAGLLKLRAINEQIYMELSNKEYGSERYYQAVKQLDDTKRDIINLEKKLFTKTEMVDLIERKASDTDDSVELIANSIDFDPYEEDKYEVLYGLLKQFGSKDAMQTGLRKMQAILKLSVDGKKQSATEMKTSLRGIAGRPIKRRINRTLINGVHLRNEVFGEVYDIMKHLDGIPNKDNFESMANHIVDGVRQAENMYQQQSSDFYKIHAMDSSIRKQKLSSVIDKDMARSTYRLIDTLLHYSKDINNTWPDEDKLSQWLNDFMEHSKNN